MSLRIISFNIWDLPLWFVKRRTTRMGKIGEYLASASADIICLQESFDVKHRKVIHDVLGDRYYIGNGHGKTRKIFGLKTFDMTGGLITYSRFPVISSRFIPFSRLLNVAFVEFLARKGFLETILKTPEGPLRVINTHLHKISVVGSSWIHARQIQKIISFLKKEVKMPTVFAGDFNEDRMMERKWFGDVIQGAGFTDPEKNRGKAILPSYRRENPFVDMWPNRVKVSERCDYIFFKGFKKAEVASYAPVPKNPPLSDHDPVDLKIENAVR
ncbi:MAG: hypothetical protein UW92_C0003G0035 [Candidatus Jorgensenbacteria bacterium GW2011_GWA2_45_13]|uniref:Endonuclease/exonuclease/phosphatase domain-containing protein n=1 Tax=Candidatus Jorgensenbacteria bacterium GW2011_GWA2_45_13 TaxID=1618662 RepID=A0A0G1L9C9_9BACT|nr:MAG: hypothetical protein UW92_C0003G0035 [Candidatus Jorgensenbacteria bacterium GW2011_GWA2_45_13]